MNKLSPFKWFCLQNFPFIEADFDALTNYELMCKIVEYLNATIDKVNVLGSEVQSLINWFNNLDVQEEINNKLDEMAESGELTEIIAEYLNTNAVLGFDSIESLKASENLIAGCFVKTYGYASVNDGGGALYKVRQVTNQDTEDDIFIIALHDEDLVAELIYNNEIKVEQAGILTDTTAANNSAALLKVINELKSGGKILFTNTYEFAPMEIDFEVQNLTFEGISRDKTILNKDADYEDFLFTFKNHAQGVVFTKLQIECNHTGGGIYLKQWKETYIEANNGYNRFEDMRIRNCEYGIYVQGGVYTKSIDLFISLGQNATSADNYCFKLEGFEYNYFIRCAFQIWIDNVATTSTSMGLLVVDSLSTLYIQETEFVSTYGYGIKVLTTAAGVRDVWMQNNTFYFVDQPIKVDSTGNSVGSVTIEKNIFYAGHGSAANIQLKGDHNFNNFHVLDNISYFSKILEIDDSKTAKTSELVLRDNWSSVHAAAENSSYTLNNNYYKLESNDNTLTYTYEKTLNAAANYHDIYINYTKIPKCAIDPVIIVQANTSSGIPVTAKDSQSADPVSGTHHVVINHPGLAAGTYTFTLKFIM